MSALCLAQLSEGAGLRRREWGIGTSSVLGTCQVLRNVACYKLLLIERCCCCCKVPEAAHPAVPTNEAGDKRK